MNRALGVSHDRKCVVHGRHEPDVSHGRRYELVGLREFREVHGHRAESCCGVQEALGSSRVACLHRLLGVHHVNRASHELGVRHGRKCAVRGLPNVRLVHP